MLEYLEPQLRAVLASLDGAPTAVQSAACQLLPFGWRAVLKAVGFAVPGDVLDELGHRTLVLTDFAPLLIAAASAQAKLASEGLTREELDRRTDEALAPLPPSRGDVATARGQQVLAGTLFDRWR